MVNITLAIIGYWKQAQEEKNKDLKLKEIIEVLRKDTNIKPYYCTGELRYKGRMVISQNSPLKHKLLIEFHSSAIGGHGGF